jgi:adenylosuccinate lyase
MATEGILMDEVKMGGDRQKYHEEIRELSMQAGRHVKEDGGDNNLLDLIAADPMFHMTREELNKYIDPKLFVGAAPHQVERYLEEYVRPMLEANKDQLGVKADIEV